MSSNDFWTSLIQGHTASTAKNALDMHLASVDDFGRAVGEDFERVRSLTDRSREANALSLPIAAGTKVSFAGGLGAYLAYDDAPNKGALGEVVNVRSANGEITHHGGKVFVQWGDGKFRSVHAEHLRRAAPSKQASELKADFEKIKALAEKKPDSDFLKSLLKQMADKGFAPTDKQMAVVKKIEAEAGEMATMQKELKGLDKKSTFRVSSVGDLTDFLKRADGKLIHKSTKDLWSFNKDADGALLVERLFDDSGEPLKG